MKEERIRLVLPSAGKEEFRKMTQELSRKGAVFDSTQKAWFINADQANRFESYLPGKLKPYKGYAYTAKGIDPKIITGESKDAVIAKMQKWNREHPDEKQYVYCNIGKLEGEKYKNYIRYDIKTGEEIPAVKKSSRVYLELPHVPKKDFEVIQEYLKNLKPPAKFDWDKKQWYVQADQADQVNNYLKAFRPSSIQPAAKKAEKGEQTEKDFLEKISKDANKWASKTPGLYSVMEGIEIQYAVRLKDGNTVNISLEEIEAKSGVNLHPSLLNLEMLDVIETIMGEKVKIIDTQEYTATIHPNANKCNIKLREKETIVEILGDQYYVDFRRLPDEEIKEIVSRHMDQLQKKPQESVLEIGKTVTFAVPYSGYSNNGFSYITGIEDIKGILTDIQHMAGQDIYSVRNTADGSIRQISSKEIYTDQQKQVLLRAAKRGLPPESFDMVAQKELNAAQMDQVLRGFADGLTIYQVAYYTNPAIPASVMDNYRYGLQHGIGYYDLKEAIGACSGKWEDCRREIDKMIQDNRQKLAKDIESKGYRVTPEIVKKVEQLNGITGRQHTLKDICEAYKAGTKDTPAGRIINALGKDFKLQQQSMELAAKVPVQ